ncbi:MAG: prepilin-type N-terminal cleavage/methylation domain-containing protein [Acidobacteria bacterium]|nr:prepilin-type N-terminal cleavage/methylation domain-containing protein [Acidobacteriota bacterium]
MRQRRNRAGFTLLEVLVATAIVGTAVAALLSLFSATLGNIQRLELPEQALLLGRTKFNELLTLGPEQSGGLNAQVLLDEKMEGRWDERFRWEAMATRYRSSERRVAGETILVRITVDVFWRTNPDRPERKLSLESYQLWREPGGAEP